jgi:hypothetical protein
VGIVARTPRRRRLVLLVVVASTVLVTAILIVLFVPISQERAGYAMIGTHLYSYESEGLFGACNGWLNFSYQGILFGFHTWCGIPSPGGGVVCGNATGADGVPHSFAFEDGPPRVGPGPWQTWVSPDAHEAVQYQQGGLVRLLVAA